MKRRPIPLEFEKPEHSSDNSFALHDAAIKSATTLMAVMNDVLKSPHLNAHFHSQQSGGLQPMHGRPRSRTAPPTPVFEAPGKEPVELPGSFLWPKSHTDARSSMDTAASSKHTSMGRAIERPHSSPQASSHPNHDDPLRTSESSSRNATDFRTLAGQTRHGRHHSDFGNRQSNSSGIVPLAPDYASPADGRALAHGHPSTLSNVSRAVDAPAQARDTIGRLLHIPSTSKVAPQEEPNQRMDLISAMRRSHDDHISLLKQAHDREIESHKSYIKFLESCAAPEQKESSNDGLTLDTALMAGKSNESLSLDVSASTSLQSLDSSIEAQRRSSVESAAAEAEALKRKLSLCRKTQSELGGIKRERDHFRETTDRSERRIGQLKDIVRKTKDNEKALRNKVLSLEAALLAANVQRIDVLDGYHEACEQISKLHEKQLIMIKERDSTSKGSGREASTFLKVHQSTGAANTGRDGTPSEQEVLSAEISELRKLISERDSRIHILEANQRNSVSKLDVCKLEKQLADAEEVRDQYNSLLHAELRRQSKIVALSVHAATPRLEAGAAATVAEKLKSKPGIENVEKRCEFLEKELKHCCSEIILYKLDIRGYRKDLKEANAKIEVLQTTRPQRPETPDSIGNQSSDCKPVSPGRRRRNTSGLGISLQRHSTPTRPSTKSLATPQQKPRATTSPSSSGKTPLELHKKLPEPPPLAWRDPSPSSALSPPTTTLNRAETLRSLSESIISSYAKRATPEQDHGHMPSLSRGRSSDPPQTGGLWPESCRAIAVPISEYTPDMLKTPSMTTTGVGKT